jgi:hypothetical protein
MWGKTVSIFFIFALCSAFGQEDDKWFKNPFKKKPLIDMTIIKSGPYFGIQRGAYAVIELGAERQWKQVTLKTAETQALHTGLNYNFLQNVLGYDLGYWAKPKRIGMTYGANLVFRTNFNESRIGLTPVIGYKLFGFHLQTGYHLLTPATDFTETNRLFVSLRFVWINQRELVNNQKKDKKKEKKYPWYKRGDSR